MRRAKLLLVFCTCWALLALLPQSTPAARQPDWVSREGIVMAGDWEPLLFRVRRDGGTGYTPSAEQMRAYAREHSPEMVTQLKALGVNFVMMHCYKGAGLEAERASMADAVAFAKLCREQGLRVGVYNYSGAFIWDLFFQELPAAKDWVVLDSQGRPVTYESAPYRYFWNRNHPAAERFYRDLVRFAVAEVKTDLVHFDNYNIGPGWDANSIDRFRTYLRQTFSDSELAAMGVNKLESVRPPAAAAGGMLQRAWQDFTSSSLAESYQRMIQYARSLRPDVLVECNPGGIGGRMRPPVDHGRLLPGGDAYWVESGRVGLIRDKLVSRIRNYKAGRALGNMTFDYTVTPLEMAESMAFNQDCLGCITWFEYDRLVAMPGSTNPVATDLQPYIRFFHQRRDLLRNTKVVADFAVLRSFPSQVFGRPENARLTAALEDVLITNQCCFQILFDTQLRRIQPGQFRVLALAGCQALDDADVEAIRRHVAAGGKLVILGPVATHDRWMRPRPTPALDGLPSESVATAPEHEITAWLPAIHQVCGNLTLRAQTQPSLGLCTEVTDQPGRRLVHLVNYRKNEPIRDVSVRLELPLARRAVALHLAGPEHDVDQPLPFHVTDGALSFRVPALSQYEIAVVELAPAD